MAYSGSGLANRLAEDSSYAMAAAGLTSPPLMLELREREWGWMLLVGVWWWWWGGRLTVVIAVGAFGVAILRL